MEFTYIFMDEKNYSVKFTCKKIKKVYNRWKLHGPVILRIIEKKYLHKSDII